MFFRKNYITLDELWKKNQKNFKQLAIIVILKLLVAEYSIKGDFVIVKLGKDYIKINNSDTPEKNGITREFWNSYSFPDRVYWCFTNKMNSLEYQGNLIEALNCFKHRYLVSGRALKGKQFYKMYYEKSPKDIDTVYEKIGRSWIDYDSQIKKRKLIYDSNRGTVIWGMTPKYKEDMIKSEQARENYGNKILTIETIPREKYVLFKKEIIGKRFRVIGEGHCLPPLCKFN